MITRAPGKLVLSGAYSVLEGSPALVTAVDRYVVADSGRVAEWLTPEVTAAKLRCRPWFDASALRAEDRKIGLGSSAAILVASLAADLLESGEVTDARHLAETVVQRAMVAHAMVQPLGSGIDVIASCFGGTLATQRVQASMTHAPVTLPEDVYFEVWSAPYAQSTHNMLALLRNFQHRQPSLYSRLIAEQAAAAEQTLDALRTRQNALFVASLARQQSALDALGQNATMPIVTDELRLLAARAAKESAAVLPAGAGGGDVAIFAGIQPPSHELRALLAELHHNRLDLSLSARGVHAVNKEC
jgi:phosphomevalonate kinase